jgi:hypothetical protein
MNQDTFEKAFNIAAQLEQSGLPRGVQAVTVGTKRIRGVETDQPALVFLVDQKRPLEELHPSMVIPAEIGGFVTDVVELHTEPDEGNPGPYDRVEPLTGGVSIKADKKGSIGTLGAIFCNRSTRQPMGLTNCHVVDSFWFNPNGQSVFQPTESPGNRIGTVWRHNKRLDCAAIALHAESRNVDRTRSFLGRPGRITSIGRAIKGMTVFKVGARTNLTIGIVDSSGPSAVVIHRQSGAEGQDLSEKGDSGAVWACETPNGYMAVALHWGGSDGIASAMPMIEIANLLELDVLDS